LHKTCTVLKALYVGDRLAPLKLHVRRSTNIIIINIIINNAQQIIMPSYLD